MHQNAYGSGGTNHAETRVLTLGHVLVCFPPFQCGNSFNTFPRGMVDCCLEFLGSKTSPNLMIWYPRKYSISIGENGIFFIVLGCCCCIARYCLIVMILGGGIHYLNGFPPLWWGWQARANSIDPNQNFFCLRPGHSVASNATPDTYRPPPIDCYITGVWRVACGGRRVPLTPSTTTVKLDCFFLTFLLSEWLTVRNNQPESCPQRIYFGWLLC